MVGELIKDVRTAKGLSQWDVAKSLGCSQTLISIWEKDYKTPSDEMKKKLSQLLGIRTEVLKRRYR